MLNDIVHNVNDIIYESDIIKIIYVGVTEYGNYLGVKLFVENKSSENIVLFSSSIDVNGNIITNYEDPIVEIAAKCIAYSHFDILFCVLNELGINCIEQIEKLSFNIMIYNNDGIKYQLIEESRQISICIKQFDLHENGLKKLIKDRKYVSSRAKNSNLQSCNSTTLSDRNVVKLWDNEFVSIIYLGVTQSTGNICFIFQVKNKQAIDVELETSSLMFGRYIVSKTCILNPILLPFKTFEDYMFNLHGEINMKFSFSTECIENLGINSIYDLDGIRCSLFCKMNGKTTLESSDFIMPIIDYEKERYLMIEAKFYELIFKIKSGEIWFNMSSMPDVIDFEFEYPNGKDGDVDMFIVSRYCKYSKLSSLKYKSSLESNNFYLMDLIFVFYNTYFSKNSKNVSSENLIDLLCNHNNIIKASELYRIARNIMSYKETLENPVIQDALRLVKEYFQKIKAERENIYSTVVINNKSNAKWKSEERLYKIVKDRYSDAIFQYRAEWLGKQSLDIYIPSLQIAIEYQGVQHYKPIDYFGGNNHFEDYVERDKRKKILCEKIM